MAQDALATDLVVEQSPHRRAPAATAATVRPALAVPADEIIAALSRCTELGVFPRRVVAIVSLLGAARDSVQALAPSPLGYAGHQRKPLQF